MDIYTLSLAVLGACALARGVLWVLDRIDRPRKLKQKG